MKVESAIEAANAAGVASKITAGGAVGAGAAWWLSSTFFGLVGAIVAVLGFVVSVYYRRKEYRFKLEQNERDKREHEARMRQLQGQCNG